MSILSHRLYNPLFSFWAKPFPIFPGWVFTCAGQCLGSENLAVLIRDLKLVATVWTPGKSLFDLSLRFLWHPCHLKSYCLINGAAFGIYTEENTLLTEPGES